MEIENTWLIISSYIMGSKVSRFSYLNALPADLKVELLKYISDIRDIIQFSELNVFNNLINDNIKVIDYGEAYKNDVKDITIDVADIQKFKSLTICQVPIVTSNISELFNVTEHINLREFSITIPKDTFTEMESILNVIIAMFDIFIKKRKSIKDMKIFICPRFNINCDNIGPFFHQQFESIIDCLQYVLWDAVVDSFSTTPVKVLLTTPIVILYNSGSLLIDPYYSRLSGYNRFFNLLYDSGNLSSLIYTFNGPYNEINSLIANKPLLNTIYLSDAILDAHYDAFRLLFSNKNITKIQYIDSILASTEKKFLYESCLKFDFESTNYVYPVIGHDKPIQLIYPFNLKNIAWIKRNLPNVSEIGIYDYFDNNETFVNKVKYLLENFTVVHIFTYKNKRLYDDLLDTYPNIVVIE